MNGHTRPAEWHGTYEEEWALLIAVAHNSTSGEKPVAVNQGMFAEQRVLDHLVFARRMVARLYAEEFEAAA